MAKKILIIEEDRVNLKLFSEILRYNGYETLGAENAMEGIRLATRGKPHLILMDTEMPVSDRLEIFKIMKSEPSIKDVPVIALSPFATMGARKKLLELGFTDCITKPFDLYKFIRIVDKHLYGGVSAE
jgi:CheY-like chemotaxis protein